MGTKPEAMPGAYEECDAVIELAAELVVPCTKARAHVASRDGWMHTGYVSGAEVRWSPGTGTTAAQLAHARGGIAPDPDAVAGSGPAVTTKG